MGPLGLSAYILSSRYVTFNLVMILLASAGVVAAFAFGILAFDEHAKAGFTVGITSATTVTVAAVAGSRAVKNRRSQRGSKRGGSSDSEGPRV